MSAQFAYDNAPFIEVINDLHNKTPYRFLYREALISNVRISMEAEEADLFRKLGPELSDHRIAMKIDSLRKQVIIYKPRSSDPSSRIRISGFVVDASSGERLPYATLRWKSNGNTGGTVTNSAGYFAIDENGRTSPLQITASYIGYTPVVTEFDFSQSDQPNELTIRLTPESIDGNEIVITGQKYFNSLSSSLENYVDIGSFSPFGDSNTIRGLQLLPSVGITTAMSNGINVRGSATDGFHVMLDGTSIFNRSHLFGLLDSFNSDVLRRSGFFYDVTPAQYQGPPGGTLSLLTQNGSLNGFHGTIGLSNSSFQATLEGPIGKGKSSWLLSGRHSYMNSVNWLNNSDLVKWGLDIDRPREVLKQNLVDVESRLVTPGDYQARFFDLHGKLYLEGDRGGRFYVSGYYGADDTFQSAERLIRTFNPDNTSSLSPINVDTQNEWYNFATSVHYENSISPSVFSHTMAGLSVYETDYAKEDFTYVQFDNDDDLLQAFVYPFENRSIINEFKIEQNLDVDVTGLLWSTGGSYQYYLGEYFENSFDRPGFFTHKTSHKFDAYTQFDFDRWNFLHLNIGGRLHYYTEGSYLRGSPRVKIDLLPDSPVSISLGYSRNYKFLHQINLYNVVSADVWVLSNESQPPSEADYFTSGLYLEPAKQLYFQVEGYLKIFDNLRLHEINTQSLTNTFAEAPWFFDNNGESKGVEVLLQTDFDVVQLTQTFSYSTMEFDNSRINGGEPFPADWDRTYRYSVTAEVNPFDHFYIFLSWLYATGTPNKLATFGPDTIERLDDYYRTDMSFEYKRKTKFGKVDLSLTLFNLLDQRNPWYREYSFVIDASQPRERLRATPVTVFDLGFQPSFKISVSF